MPRWSSFDPALDQKLVKGLNDVEEHAVAALYDHYAERLYDYTMSIADDHAAAADIVHDTFIDALRRAPRMRNRDHLRPWLYAAARRRCLQRVHGSALSLEFSGDAAAIRAEVGLSPERLRALLAAVLGRLDFADQEILLLALRHGLTAADVAATRGTGPRRAGRRMAAARSRFAAALTAELNALARDVDGQDTAAAAKAGAETDAQASDARASDARASDAGDPGAGDPDTGVPDTDAAGTSAAGTGTQGTGTQGTGTAGTGASSTALTAVGPLDIDRVRARLSAEALLSLPSAPVLPAALRHRVVHTGTDPELAGYRADIAARGGNLTSAGLPRQPDLPSPMVRQWIFTGSGMAGLLVAALVAVLVIHPKLPVPNIDWFDRHPPSSPIKPSPGATASSRPAPPAAVASRGPAPGSLPHRPSPSQSPTGAPPVSAPPPPSGHGVLQVGPDRVEIAAKEKVAHLELTAYQGPVEWSAKASTSQITLSATQGSIPVGGTQQVNVILDRGLLMFPGEATVTFSTLTRGQSGNVSHDITVSWSGSLL